MPTPTDADRERWNRLVLGCPYPSFMQSWEWGEVQSQFGLQTERVSGADGQALVVQRPLPFSRSWLYVPRGPIDIHSQILERLARLGRERRGVFVRIDPAVPADAPAAAAWQEQLQRAGFVPAARQVQPQHTTVVDAAQTDAQLLAAMHAKTRYNIRLAERKGVTVRFSTSAEDLGRFLHLAEAVRERGGFRYHPASYYQAMLAVLGKSRGGESPEACAELAVAEHAGETLAVHVLIFFGEAATYAHGASSSLRRELMAPHLLQWASIQRARERGAKHYDFFGVAPASAKASAGKPPHPWAGITRFKEGFGGQRVSYIGAWDLVLEPALYTGFNIARRLRRLL